MKKLLASSTILTIMMVAMPAMAHMQMPSSDIKVDNDNHACVSNTVIVSADTGSNEIVAVKGGSVSGDITTGDAYVDSIVENSVNYNDTKIKASCRRGCAGDIEVENDNGAMVRNEVDVSADTGDNEIITVKGGSNSGGDIRTGDAWPTSSIVNVVNTNITRVRR